MKLAICVLLLAAGCRSSVSRSASTPPAPQKTGTDVVGVIVTLSGTRALPEVVRDLQQRGLAVEQQLAQIDTVTGRAPPTALAALRSVNGVKAVELDQPVQLPPADKPQ
jgi:hypothetical protein